MISSRVLGAIPKRNPARKLPALYSTMATTATPYKVNVQPSNSGILSFDRDDKTANQVSELLQTDLEVRQIRCVEPKL